MLEPRSDRIESSPDRELVFTRVLDAPRHLVFAAWTSREHLPRWYGPHGFTTTVETMDCRTGGTLRLVMHGPDGARYPNSITYDEVRPPERLAYTTRGGREGSAESQLKHIVTFEAQGERTKVTLRLVFPTAAAKADNIATYHSDVGGTQTLERLAAAMDELVVRGRKLELDRTFAAPRALVWDAFTQPDHVKRWLAPRPLTMPIFELDLRAGGAMRMVMRAPDGTEFPSSGTVRDVRVGERLAWGGKIHDDIEVETIITFADEGTGTRVTVHQSYSSEGDPTRGARMGWNASLDALAELLAEAQRH
jgi:uncharacterized protein YndB with AHSA1/START domain